MCTSRLIYSSFTHETAVVTASLPGVQWGWDAGDGIPPLFSTGGTRQYLKTSLQIYFCQLADARTGKKITDAVASIDQNLPLEQTQRSAVNDVNFQQMLQRQAQKALKSFFAGAPPRTPLGELKSCFRRPPTFLGLHLWSLSVQPFCRLIGVPNTCTHTDHGTCDVCNNRPHRCDACDAA